jgi:hypothetical protein
MTNKKTPTPPGVDVEHGKVRFDYIKSSHFKVIHVNGVYGGNTAHGEIMMSVWNERYAIPKQVAYELRGDGQLGEEIPEDRVTRDAIVREVEASLVMSIETAKQVRDWLDEKVTAMSKILGQTEAAKKQGEAQELEKKGA